MRMYMRNDMTGKSCRVLLDLLAKKGAFSPQL
jgi:hypothetical protein